MGMAADLELDGSWLNAITCRIPPVASWGLRPITGDVRMGSLVAVERICGVSTVPDGSVVEMYVIGSIAGQDCAPISWVGVAG